MHLKEVSDSEEDAHSRKTIAYMHMSVAVTHSCILHNNLALEESLCTPF